MTKYFLYAIFIAFTLSINLFSEGYKILSQHGDISITLDEENADFDVKNYLPTNYFKLETESTSYIILEKENKSMILMPNSKMSVVSNEIILEEGYLYTKSKNTNNIVINIGNNKNRYKIDGHSFAIIASDNKLKALTYKNSIKLTSSINPSLDYYLEPYNHAQIFPLLTNPRSLTQNEKGLIESVSRQLETEIDDNLNKVVERYSFKIFEKTRNETEIYRVISPNKGPNIFLIVPHGNERTGTDVAIERVEMPIKKGSLTIVPIASAYSYKMNSRYLDGEDINNKFFKRKKDKNDVEKLATRYMKMLDEYDIDVVITLHEGNGFEEFFGDSIIYDTRRLDNTVKHILGKINARIQPYKYKFKQMYHPMPTTITYYATQKGINAYGIELTRNLPYENKRIIMHAIVDEFLRVYGLI